ncbi:uncharacterized protein LOC141613260 [Silene latifolia]|uniref:uncharacterized protein LOC141613260 n=1 Tax=Silene latifolia TaxID=37657 RepID=UPI003D777B39
MKRINKICKDYFWNIGDGSTRMVFKSWQHICRPSQEGGFNIKELLSWNRALLAKWIWLLSGNDGGIWAAWNRAYVFPTGSIWQMTLKDRLSESMCNIIKVKDEILAKVGTPEDGLSLVHSWVRKGKFQVHLAYDWFRTKGNTSCWTKALQGRSIIPKHWVNASLAATRSLPTVDLLSTRGISIVNRCVLCKAQAKTHRHLFFRCSYSQEVWTGLLSWMHIAGRSNDLSTELHWIGNSKGRRHWKHEWRKGCIAAVVYYIWQERNKRIFLGKDTTAELIIGQIKFVIRSKLTNCMNASSPLLEARLHA